MKSWITTFAVAALALAGASTSAEARPHRGHEISSHVYISGYRSCGTPIYTEKYLVGYTRRGYPIWRYRVVEAPRRYYRPEPRPRYYAAPPRPHYDRHHDGGIIIQGSIRL